MASLGAIDVHHQLSGPALPAALLLACGAPPNTPAAWPVPSDALAPLPDRTAEFAARAEAIGHGPLFDKARHWTDVRVDIQIDAEHPLRPLLNAWVLHEAERKLVVLLRALARDADFRAYWACTVYCRVALRLADVSISASQAGASA